FLNEIQSALIPRARPWMESALAQQILESKRFAAALPVADINPQLDLSALRMPEIRPLRIAAFAPGSMPDLKLGNESRRGKREALPSAGALIDDLLAKIGTPQEAKAVGTIDRRLYLEHNEVYVVMREQLAALRHRNNLAPLFVAL